MRPLPTKLLVAGRCSGVLGKVGCWCESVLHFSSTCVAQRGYRGANGTHILMHTVLVCWLRWFNRSGYTVSAILQHTFWLLITSSLSTYK